MIPAISGVLGLNPAEWTIGGLGSATAPAAVDPASLAAAAGAAPVSGATGASFGDALTKAIGSLESSQASATQAAQGLASGTVTDPTKAVTAVENASLSMDFASQIRNKLDDAATTIFQSQV